MPSAISQFEMANKIAENKSKYYKLEQDGTAKVSISGVLRNGRSWMDSLIGIKTSLTYDEIIEAMAEIDSDPLVKKVDMYFDTPGGEVLGCDNASVAISMLKKPTTAYVKNMCASGGMYLASQCDKIVALSEGSVLGSIGVMQRMWTADDLVTLTSSNAYRKSPDPTTKQGKAYIIEELDEMELLMLQRIAEGRGVTVETVKEKFGNGGTMLAKRALEVGMIDKIQTQKLIATYVPPTIDPGTSPNVEPDNKKPKAETTHIQVQETDNKTTEYSPNKGQNKKEKKMDIQTLQKEFPEVFAQAVKLGEENERKRVNQFTAYKQADPENEKLCQLCDQYMAEGKNIEDVRPSLEVAIRDFKKVGGANPPSVSTESTDPAQASASIGAEPSKVNEIEQAKSFVAKLKEKGAFKR